MASDISWKMIWDDKELDNHDFSKSPVIITAKEIKTSCQKFKKTSDKEVRILCKQNKREDRPQIFKDNGLFLLPQKMAHIIS